MCYRQKIYSSEKLDQLFSYLRQHVDVDYSRMVGIELYNKRERNIAQTAMTIDDIVYEDLHRKDRKEKEVYFLCHMRGSNRIFQTVGCVYSDPKVMFTVDRYNGNLEWYPHPDHPLDINPLFQCLQKFIHSSPH